MRPEQHRRGGGLIVVLILMTLLASASLAFVSIFGQMFAASRLEAARLPTLYLAEGGLARARWSLARDPAYTGEQLELAGGQAQIRVSGLAEDPQARTVEVEAWDGPERRAHTRLRVQLRLGDGLPVVQSWRED